MPKKLVTFTSTICIEIEVREGVTHTGDLSQEEADQAWEQLYNRSEEDGVSIWSMEEGDLEDL